MMNDEKDYHLYAEEFENDEIDEVRRKRYRSAKKLSYPQHQHMKESKKNGTKHPKKPKRNRVK
jgi:hypothetical protein